MIPEIKTIILFYSSIIFFTTILSLVAKRIYLLGNIFLICNQIVLLTRISRFEDFTIGKNFVFNGFGIKATTIILTASTLSMLIQDLHKRTGFMKNLMNIIMSLGVIVAIASTNLLTFFLGAEIVACSICFYIATSGRTDSALGALRYYIKSGFTSGLFLLFCYFHYISTEETSFYKNIVQNYNIYALALCFYVAYGFSKIGLSPFNSKLIDKFEHLDYRGFAPVFFIGRMGIIFSVIEKFQHLIIKALPVHQQYLIYFILIISVFTCFYMGAMVIWSKELNRSIGFAYISQISFLGIYMCYEPSYDVLENFLLLNLTLHVALVLCAVPVIYLKKIDGEFSKGRWKLGAYSIIWGALTLIGLPPSLGVLSKIYTISSFIKEGYLVESVSLVIGLFLSINLIGKAHQFNFDKNLLSNSGLITSAPVRLKIFTMVLLLLSIIGIILFKNILQII